MAEGHRVSVYYQTQYDHSLQPNSPYGHYVSPLPLISFITHLILAAFHINANKPITIALNDHAPEDPYYDQMWADIATMQNSGVKVLGMLGGAAPGTYPCLTPENFDTFYPKLAFYIRKYKLDGMDLDVEESVELDDITHLINRLKQDFGDNFIITLAPVASALQGDSNLSGFDYYQLEKSMGKHINWYNAQFFSGFGEFFPDKQYIDIVEYKDGLSPSRLVATVLTNPDNGGGYVDPENVASSVRDLSKKYGYQFGGVGGWEYFDSLPNRDEPWQWASLMKKSMDEIKSRRADFLRRQTVERSRIWSRQNSTALL